MDSEDVKVGDVVETPDGKGKVKEFVNNDKVIVKLEETGALGAFDCSRLTSGDGKEVKEEVETKPRGRRGR